MSEAYLRPGKILEAYSRLYPDAWKLVDEFRADGKRLGDRPDWCFLPLAGAYAIASRGRSSPPGESIPHVGIMGALAAWRVTQGIYRFDPTVLDALWETPVAGDIPTEVLFHLPEWCVYAATPDRRWRGDELHGFFAHLEHDVNDRRAELRLILDGIGARGDEPVVMPIHLGQGGVAAMLREAFRHTPLSIQMPDDPDDGLADDVSPLVSLVLYLCSQAAEVRAPGGYERSPARPQPVKTKKGLRLFPPERPTPWEIGYLLGAALKRAMTEARTPGSSGGHASPRPHIGRAHCHSYRVGRRDQAEARSVVLKWLPPIPVNLQDVEGLAPTVRDVLADGHRGPGDATTRGDLLRRQRDAARSHAAQGDRGGGPRRSPGTGHPLVHDPAPACARGHRRRPLPQLR